MFVYSIKNDMNAIQCDNNKRQITTTTTDIIVMARIFKVKGGRDSGGARGGLGAIALRRSMLAPRRKVKSDFLEIFGIYNTLKTIF